MKIVTSLNPDRIVRQKGCLASWRKVCKDVVAVQLESDMERIDQRDYPGVKFVTTDMSGKPFGVLDTPRIKAMANVAVDSEESILILNSDIKIASTRREFNRDWCEPTNDMFRVGIRWEHEKDKKPKLNLMGIDAFRLTPEQAKQLPDIGYSIGTIGWD